jgi:hypothetical protein
MTASQALRPLAGVVVAASLVACSGPVARRAGSQTPVTVGVPTTAADAAPASTEPPGTAVTPAGSATSTTSGPTLRTDDLDAALRQLDSQLSQTGSAVADSDRPSQQSND